MLGPTLLAVTTPPLVVPPGVFTVTCPVLTTAEEVPTVCVRPVFERIEEVVWPPVLRELELPPTKAVDDDEVSPDVTLEEPELEDRGVDRELSVIVLVNMSN